MPFTHALVRPPGANFADGLTSEQGSPDYPLALAQHQDYCRALRRCGLELITLPALAGHPDGTFVEDTAVLIRGLAIITRPGAPTRAGETASVEQGLTQRFSRFAHIAPPGTVDGGDICEAGERFFIGVSARTNSAGAEQLGRLLDAAGYRVSVIDIRASKTLLHLKSGVAHLGDGLLVLSADAPQSPDFAEYETIRLPHAENYAANCVRVNDRVLVAAGYAETAALLEKRGYSTIALNMSEFKKMDGGLSCLSLRF